MWRNGIEECWAEPNKTLYRIPCTVFEFLRGIRVWADSKWYELSYAQYTISTFNIHTSRWIKVELFFFITASFDSFCNMWYEKDRKIEKRIKYWWSVCCKQWKILNILMLFPFIERFLNPNLNWKWFLLAIWWTLENSWRFLLYRFERHW